MLATGLLARREHSRLELEKKLSQKNYSKAVIDEVLNQLQAQNYLNERRFIEAFIKSKAQRGYGPNYISQAIGEKGITTDALNEVMVEMEMDWHHFAKAVFIKKFKTKASDGHSLQKQKRFMYYRGFSQDIIKNVLAED